MAHSHVPKFGNWEADNIPYSAYFEIARREKAESINPNDPIENPEAFKIVSQNVNVNDDELEVIHVKASHTHSHKSSSMEKESNEVSRNQSRRHMHRKSKGSQGSFTTEHKRSVSKGASTIGSFSSSSNNRHKSASHSFHDHVNHDKATAAPKFGNWDATDPKSGEGYTTMFSKIKEERKNMSSHIAPPVNKRSNINNQYAEPSNSNLSKYCCCLFSNESK